MESVTQRDFVLEQEMGDACRERGCRQVQLEMVGPRV